MSLTVELGLRPVSRSPLTRFVRWFVATRFGAGLLSGRLQVLDRWALRISAGRTSFSDLFGGVPTILLTTTGARTGLPRTSQLIVVPCGDDRADLAVLGSNFGRARAPLWVSNLSADPHAVAAHRGRQVPVLAREVFGPEADRIRADARAVYRGFVTYPEMVGERPIRIFRLSAARS